MSEQRIWEATRGAHYYAAQHYARRVAYFRAFVRDHGAELNDTALYLLALTTRAMAADHGGGLLTTCATSPIGGRHSR